MTPPATAPAPAPAPTPRLFARVRIKGTIHRGGARVTLLTVRVRSGARVQVRCKGRGCKRRAVAQTARLLRYRRLQGFLRAGTILEVRVTYAGTIGKYTRFRIRGGAAPVRTDRCLVPGSPRPTPCA